jgi:hypothetical protein
VYLSVLLARLNCSMAINGMTRREWGAATGASLCLSAAPDLFAASGFWNRKDPSAWSSDEVLQLATRSPWAISARVLPKPGRDRGSFQPNAPEVGGGRSGGRGTGPEPVIAVTEVTVVWESAKPLLDALKSTFPADFANHYVIGINDLPQAQRKRQVNFENMSASLQARGRDPVDAGAIQPAQNGMVVLFGFSKELLPLTATDRDILFTMETDLFSVRAKFDPKEMMYQGALAI